MKSLLKTSLISLCLLLTFQTCMPVWGIYTRRVGSHHPNDIPNTIKSDTSINIERPYSSIFFPRKKIVYQIWQTLYHRREDTLYYVVPAQILYDDLVFKFRCFKTGNDAPYISLVRARPSPDTIMKILPNFGRWDISSTLYVAEVSSRQQKRMYKRRIKRRILEDTTHHIRFDARLYAKKDQQLIPIDTIPYRQFTFPKTEYDKEQYYLKLQKKNKGK